MMHISNGKWRGFFAHLGPYVIVIGVLAVINVLTDPAYLWFLWPALGWGVAIAFHLLSISLESMANASGKWRAFLGHFGSYLIIIGMLGLINLATTSYPWFLWPALGWGIAVAMHLWGTLVSGSGDDKRLKHQVVEELHKTQPRSEAQPLEREKFTSQTIQVRLDKAQIDQMVHVTADENSRARLQDLADQVKDWTQAIEALGRRVDDFQQNSLIHQDLETVPKSIKDLETRLADETDEALRTELERALANRKNQRASLERLQSMMNRAELQIESTLSSLGTIYSQILTGQSTDHVADYSRLSSDVDEEVRLLQDHLEALEEVKLGRGY